MVLLGYYITFVLEIAEFSSTIWVSYNLFTISYSWEIELMSLLWISHGLATVHSRSRAVADRPSQQSSEVDIMIKIVILERKKLEDREFK